MNQNTQHGLCETLKIPRERGITAIVGGGGKTSLMYALSAEYAKENIPVVITTTTRIGLPPAEKAVFKDCAKLAPNESVTEPGRVVCVCSLDEKQKLRCPDDAAWQRCEKEATRIFAECDGARMLPVKAPDDHEPCIPDATDTVIAVAGLSAIGKTMEQTVFRCEIACDILGVSPKDVLAPKLLARLLSSPKGQFKGVKSVNDYRVFLNQADDENRLALATQTAEYIKKQLPGCVVVAGTLEPTPLIKAVF